MSGLILISGCPKCISNRRSDHECGYWRLIQRQPIQRHDFFPGQLSRWHARTYEHYRLTHSRLTAAHSHAMGNASAISALATSGKTLSSKGELVHQSKTDDGYG